MEETGFSGSLTNEYFPYGSNFKKSEPISIPQKKVPAPEYNDFYVGSPQSSTPKPFDWTLKLSHLLELENQRVLVMDTNQRALQPLMIQDTLTNRNLPRNQAADPPPPPPPSNYQHFYAR